MAWEKSPEPLVERFGRVVERFPELERRMMFGYPAAFVRGNMVTGLHQQNWVVRLSDADRETATAEGAAPFEPMPGRRMGGFVTLPTDALDDDALARWVALASAHARTLPPKR